MKTNRERESFTTSPSIGELSFPELYNEYQSMIRAVIYRISGRLDLDDLVQEAFVKVWKSQTSFKGQSSLKTWIYRISVNVAIDHCRKKKEFLEYRDESSPNPKGTGKEQILDHKDLVKKLFLSLDTMQRTLLTLQAVEGLTISEIAEVMDLPEGTVKSKLFYAKEKASSFLIKKGVKL